MAGSCARDSSGVEILNSGFICIWLEPVITSLAKQSPAKQENLIGEYLSINREIASLRLRSGQASGKAPSY